MSVSPSVSLSRAQANELREVVESELGDEFSDLLVALDPESLDDPADSATFTIHIASGAVE